MNSKYLKHAKCKSTASFGKINKRKYLNQYMQSQEKPELRSPRFTKEHLETVAGDLLGSNFVIVWINGQMDRGEAQGNEQIPLTFYDRTKMGLYQEIRRGNNTLTESHLRQQLLHEHAKELESVVRQREKANEELQRALEENDALY